MMKTAIQGMAIRIKKEGLLPTLLPMGIGRNIITGITPTVQSIMTADGKYTFT
jgi:hypothetical protein